MVDVQVNVDVKVDVAKIIRASSWLIIAILVLIV